MKLSQILAWLGEFSKLLPFADDPTIRWSLMVDYGAVRKSTDACPAPIDMRFTLSGFSG